MKKLFLLFTLCAMALSACEKESKTDYSSTIVLAKKEVKFGKSGGTQIVEFTISNPSGGKVTVEDNAEWIDAAVEFNSEVIITAEANEGAAREAVITVKYAGAKDATITVTQRDGNSSDYDVEFTAKHFEGSYFGTEFSSNYNYFVVLSDIGTTINGEPKANGTYYFFDFYSKVAGDVEAPVLPNGTYTFDAKNSYADLTFSEEGSWYGIINEQGKYATSLNYRSATVTVQDNKFEAVIEMSTGDIHRVVYEGDLTVASDNILSTFTKDFTFDITGASISATNYGDTLSVGKQSWYIEAIKGDDLFMLEIFSANSDNPSGIYTAITGSSSENYDNKFLPGFIGDSGLVGTWYAKLTDNTIKGDVMAPVFDGLIQITVEEGTATITYSATDDAGNKIEGKVSGNYTKQEPVAE